jgi:hypothetical protein
MLPSRAKRRKSEISRWDVKRKVYLLAIVAVFLLATNFAGAQESMLNRFDRVGGSINFKGQINAYSPQTAPTGTAGPYEVRGPWSLKLWREHGSEKAEFSAAVNMELSDGWVLTTNRNSATPFDPSVRNAHTHHITLTDNNITSITRLANGGIQVIGTGFVTLNGGPTPFAQQSQLTITITGGTDVEFSNMTLLFGAPASGHFGMVPLPGVVRSVQIER